MIYTVWLKRRTPQNIVIGGAAGAFPPMIGWAAVTGSIALEPFLLFLIIFLWTPPHFWALSLLRADDYARARVPMLPVVAGPDETRRQICSIPSCSFRSAWRPGCSAGRRGLWRHCDHRRRLMVAFAWRVSVMREASGAARRRAMFAYSILYLFVLFACCSSSADAGLVGRVAHMRAW